MAIGLEKVILHFVIFNLSLGHRVPIHPGFGDLGQICSPNLVTIQEYRTVGYVLLARINKHC
jgi:hypothetical protein